MLLLMYVRLTMIFGSIKILLTTIKPSLHLIESLCLVLKMKADNSLKLYISKADLWKQEKLLCQQLNQMK